jgi:hypothetical protein
MLFPLLLLAFHDGVDLFDRRFFSDGGDVDVEHGGSQVLVTHVLLNELEADAGFEQMGCVAVPQRVRRDAAVLLIELVEDGCDDPLNRRLAHGMIGRGSQLMVASLGGENPDWVSMGGPVLSQRIERRNWEWDKPVLSSFATMDMDKHAFGIDIGSLQMKSFLEAQSHAIDGCKEAVHGRFFDELQERMDFARGDDGGQFQFGFDACELENGPIFWASDPEEEFQGLLGDVDSAGSPLLGIDDVEQVFSELIFGSEFGVVSDELGKTLDGTGIRLLSARELATKLEILFESIDDWVGRQRRIGIGHRRTPWRRTTSAVTGRQHERLRRLQGFHDDGSNKALHWSLAEKHSKSASQSDQVPLPRSGLLETRDGPASPNSGFPGG